MRASSSSDLIVVSRHLICREIVSGWLNQENLAIADLEEVGWASSPGDGCLCNKRLKVVDIDTCPHLPHANRQTPNLKCQI